MLLLALVWFLCLFGYFFNVGWLFACNACSLLSWLLGWFEWFVVLRVLFLFVCLLLSICVNLLSFLVCFVLIWLDLAVFCLV